jgi:hypothetical protein
MHLLIIIASLREEEALLITFASLSEQTNQNFSVRIQDPFNGSQSSRLRALGSQYLFSLETDHSGDTGISHAFNKALLSTLAPWTHVLFLGAGDSFIDSSSVATVYQLINFFSDSLLHSFGVKRTDKHGNTIYIDNPSEVPWRHLVYKNIFPHQGLVYAKSFFECFGLYSLSCKYSMDYELLLRSYKAKPKSTSYPIVLANWVEGGIGSDRTTSVLMEYHRNRTQTRAFGRFASSFFLFLSWSSYSLRRIKAYLSTL